MSLEQKIRNKIENALNPNHLEVFNESYMHNVPPQSETHFKLIVVTNQFDEKSRIQRHQIINNLLASELSGNLHALSITTFTPSEWASSDKKASASPKCMGGEKTGSN